MAHVATNPHEEKARLAKATALAEALHGWEHAIDMIASEQADQAWWDDLAKTAGVNPPSQATIDLTITIIRRRAASPTGSDEAASGNPTVSDGPPSPGDRRAADPFDGLNQNVSVGHRSLG